MSKTGLQRSTSNHNKVPSRGAPTKYKPFFNKQAYHVCLLGATDKQLANFFDVNPDTIYEWKKKYQHFSESIKRGKLIADAAVAEALYKRAIGCKITVQRVIKLTTKRPVLNETGELTDTILQSERVQVVDLIQELPPDTTAAIFWLKNKNPENWNIKRVHTNDPEKPMPATVIIWDEAKQIHI